MGLRWLACLREPRTAADFPRMAADFPRTAGLREPRTAADFPRTVGWVNRGRRRRTPANGRPRSAASSSGAPPSFLGPSICHSRVAGRTRETRASSAAFETFIPRRSRSEPKQSRGPGPAWSEDRRRAQKASVATRAPPPPAGRARGYRSRRGRRELREVIQTKRSQQHSCPDWSKNEHLLPSLGGSGFPSPIPLQPPSTPPN